MSFFSQKSPGFTLIELIVVIGIIGIILSISTISLINIQKRGRDDRRILDTEELQEALARYHSNQPGGFYPTNLNILVAERYIDKLPLDPSSGTSTPYSYVPAPVGCNNSAGNFCLDYELSILLESGTVHTTGPMDL